MHPCGDAFCTTRAPPPHPLQRHGERLAAQALRFLLRKLANGEVCLLLAGARLTESYTRISTTARRGQGLFVLLRTWHGTGIVASVKENSLL
jgi:hypothetical protein